MKKSVILLIGIIYIVSIVVVTFFGMKINVDQFPIRMEEISVTNYDSILNGKKYIFLDFDEEKVLADGYISTFVLFETGPDNASYPEKVSFSISNNEYTKEDGEKGLYADVTANGEVIFYQMRTVSVTVYTTDGSNISDTVYIRCRKQ